MIIGTYFGVFMLLACSTLTAQATFVNVNLGPDDGVYLDWLCTSIRKIRLFKLSHLDILAAKVDNGLGIECKPEVLDAIVDLKKVVDANKDKECSMDAFDNYRQFYLKYLDGSERNKEMIKLPGQLFDFALAYGVELSAQCRANMVKVLLDDGSKAVTAEDFDAVKEYIDLNGPIARIFGEVPNRPDEMVLPSDLDAVTGRNKQILRKIGINTETVPTIKQTQRRCELQFKPVYESMMLPVARFADLGFEHRNQELERVIEEASANDETRDTIIKWSRVAFLCEMLGKIELVQEQEDAEKSEGSDATRVFVLTKDDAAKRDQVQGNNLLDVVEANGERIEPVSFEPKLSVEIQEKILSTTEQKRAVGAIDTKKDEVAIIKRRFWMMATRGLWNEVTHLRLGVFISKIFDLLKKWIGANREEDEDTISTQIVMSMNDVVDRTHNLDRTVKIGLLAAYFITAFIMCLAIYINDRALS